MKILQDKYREYTEIIELYNQVYDEPLTWQIIIDEALENLLTNPETDWSWLRHYCYYPTKSNPKPWEPVFYKCNSSRFEEYLVDNINMDDIINFALKFNRPNLVKYKKLIIDASWTVDKILLVLEHYTMTDNLRYGDDYVNINCPNCTHETMKIWINEDKSVLVSCFAITCKLNKTNIWKLFEITVETMFTTVDKVWHIVNNINNISLDKIKRLEGIRVNKPFTNSNLNKIIADCVVNNPYLKSNDFTEDILQECAVYFRDNKVNPSCSESNDFRQRVCYTIRDLNGNLAGVQGRSIFNEDWQRNNYIKSDSFFRTHYLEGSPSEEKRNKIEKIGKKTINTVGFKKSEHLYLLHKYTNNTQDINSIVITEGPKDAIRVFGQKLNGVAVVSIMGAEISATQLTLLRNRFGVNKQYILAFDGDRPGYTAALKAHAALDACGFRHISFILYPRVSPYGPYYKDFGDISSADLITFTLHNSVSLRTYNAEMEDRLPYIDVITELQGKEKRKEIKKMPHDDFECLVPIKDLPSEVIEIFGIRQ